MEYLKKVNDLIISGKYSITSMSIYLGISRPTLYKRFKNNDWKKGEKELIKSL